MVICCSVSLLASAPVPRESRPHGPASCELPLPFPSDATTSCGMAGKLLLLLTSVEIATSRPIRRVSSTGPPSKAGSCSTSCFRSSSTRPSRSCTVIFWNLIGSWIFSLIKPLVLLSLLLVPSWMHHGCVWAPTQTRPTSTPISPLTCPFVSGT